MIEPPVIPEAIANLASDLEDAMRVAEAMAQAQRSRRLIEAILAETDDDLDDAEPVPMDSVVEDIHEIIQDLEAIL